ncbi:MAG TPA: acetate--CoA ligase family protein, partial [Actinomycetes bacterium]|nr:acetate--CoA ligase family protein [Actinomycetes bacterium]
ALQHKSDIGALELGVQGAESVGLAFDRLRAIDGHASTPVLVEQMAEAGVELLVSARRDAIVPVLVIGLGGVWVEIASDAVVIPLPANSTRVLQALQQLRGAALLNGGRGRPAVDLTAVADLAVRVGRALFEHDLELIELNPVFARPGGVTAVDAVARRIG